MLRSWLRNLRTSLACSIVGLLAATGSARAQESAAELKARLDRGDREIQDMKVILNARRLLPAVDENTPTAALSDSAVKKVVEGYLAAKEQQKAEAEFKFSPEGFEVGSDRRMTANWDFASGFTAQTANKDFTLHVGGELMQDAVWFTQSPVLKSPAQFGDLQDGTFFRRLRIFLDGTAWQVFEWNIIYAVEQVKEGIPTLSEAWVGEKDIPWVGRIRVGQQRLPQGLEGDTSASSRAMTFMEASPMTDALHQRFGTGLWAGNAVLNERATWSGMAYRQTQALHDLNGADFGDGKYAVAGRLTFLPVYENEGRCLVHVGASANWRKSENLDPGLADPGVVRFRARPELRDATGDYGTLGLPGNTSRLVDTGNIFSSASTLVGTELMVINGPFSLMAEWAVAYVDDASLVAGGPGSTRSVNGGYVSVGYFLTGEHRAYTPEFGRVSKRYLEGPITNFWLTRAEQGNLSLGRGAWEIAARYSYLNLNDGPINGGVQTGFVAGLNWFLSPNVRVEFNYTDDNRYSLKPGLSSGVVQGLGTRFYFQF